MFLSRHIDLKMSNIFPGDRVGLGVEVLTPCRAVPQTRHEFGCMWVV